MKLADHLKPGGKGVMATAGADGAVNTAIYALPHRTEENTVAWGMTERRTYRNIRENPTPRTCTSRPGTGTRG